jgi:hypothetical protein
MTGTELVVYAAPITSTMRPGVPEAGLEKYIATMQVLRLY